MDVDDTTKPEMLWITESQLLLVKDSHFDNWMKQFDLFLDLNGIWRCRGRISNVQIPFSTKHPIPLHKDHHLNKLFVMSAHVRVLHNRVKEMLTEIRSRLRKGEKLCEGNCLSVRSMSEIGRNSLS